MFSKNEIQDINKINKNELLKKQEELKTYYDNKIE